MPSDPGRGDRSDREWLGRLVEAVRSNPGEPEPSPGASRSNRESLGMAWRQLANRVSHLGRITEELGAGQLGVLDL